MYYVDDGEQFRNAACDASMLIAYNDASATVCYTTNSAGLRVVDSLSIGNPSGIPTWTGFWQGIEIDLLTSTCEAWLNSGGGNFAIRTTSNTSEGYSHCTHLFRGYLGSESLGWNQSGGEILGLSAY